MIDRPTKAYMIAVQHFMVSVTNIVQDMRDQMDGFPLSETEHIDKNLRAMENCIKSIEYVIKELP